MLLQDLSLKKLKNALLNKEFSALELTKDYLKEIEERDKKLGSYLSLHKATAIEQAEKVDIAVAGGNDIPFLAGAPFAIKDNILIEGTRVTAASKILENYEASYDATVIKKLKEASAIFLGKTNLDEFAMGSSTENSAFQLTRNPQDPERVPGGSSGGSVAAVAANLALAGLGSDTGGSIRQPAAFCGVVGLRPTYGAVSRFGLIAMASSLDQIGPITKTVEDAAILFKEISGRDVFDATSVNSPGRGYGDELLNPKLENIQKLKIGLPKEYFELGLEKSVETAVNSAIDSLKSLKLEFREISLPHTKYALSCYYIIVPAEVSSNLARFDGIRYSRLTNLKFSNLKEIYLNQRGLGFGGESQRRILLGTFVLSAGYYDAYYRQAQKVRSLIRQDFENALREVDVILTPVTPTTAFKIGERIKDPLSMYMSDIFTIPSSIAGLPAVSIPVKNRGGQLPIGFQLIGNYFREADILGIGQFYENNT